MNDGSDGIKVLMLTETGKWTSLSIKGRHCLVHVFLHVKHIVMHADRKMVNCLSHINYRRTQQVNSGETRAGRAVKGIVAGNVTSNMIFIHSILVIGCNKYTLNTSLASRHQREGTDIMTLITTR